MDAPTESRVREEECKKVVLYQTTIIEFRSQKKLIILPCIDISSSGDPLHFTSAEEWE